MTTKLESPNSFGMMEMEYEDDILTQRYISQFRKSILRYRVLALVLGFFTILFFSLFIMASSRRGVKNESPESNPSSNEAIHLANLSDSILGAMNTKVDPCEDFYEYVCGTWLKETTIPGDRSSWTKSFSKLNDETQQVLKEILSEDWPIIGPFYSSCMGLDAINQKGFQPLESIMQNLENLHEGDLISFVGEMHAISASMFFELFIDADPKNPNENLVFLWQGGLGLPSKDYYFDDSFSDLRSEYLKHIKNYLELAGEPGDLSEKANKIMQLETLLANYSLAPAETRDPEATYHKKSFSELKELTPNIDWGKYFQSVGAASVPEQLNVAMPSFVELLDQFFVQSSLSDSKLYMKWHIIRAFSNFLSQEFIDEAFQWKKTLYGAKKPTPREKFCISETDGLFGELLGRYYVEKNFPGDSKKIAQQLVDELEEAFSQNLDQLTWMDKETKEKARKKLHQITNKIGYPDKWTNYNSMEIDDNFFGNILKARKFLNDLQIAKIGKEVDKSEWFMTPATINAYYNPTANEIVFPAAILQKPFFSQHNPAFANFGAIGAVIGHEITHGFDDQGSQYDGTGRLSTWWSSKVIEAFKEKAQCIVDQYSTFEVLPELYINGKLTEGENIADLGGLRIAYIAYKNWAKKHGEGYSKELIEKYFKGFTVDQLFFINFGQVWCGKQTDEYAAWLTNNNPHSLDKFRTFGATRNLEAFWDAFKCKKGTPMHPKESCRVW